MKIATAIGRGQESDPLAIPKFYYEEPGGIESFEDRFPSGPARIKEEGWHARQLVSGIHVKFLSDESPLTTSGDDGGEGTLLEAKSISDVVSNGSSMLDENCRTT